MDNTSAKTARLSLVLGGLGSRTADFTADTHWQRFLLDVWDKHSKAETYDVNVDLQENTERNNTEADVSMSR